MTLRELIAQLAALRDRLPAAALPLFDELLAADDDERRVELVRKILEATPRDADVYPEVRDIVIACELLIHAADARVTPPAPAPAPKPAPDWAAPSGRRRGWRRLIHPRRVEPGGVGPTTIIGPRGGGADAGLFDPLVASGGGGSGGGAAADAQDEAVAGAVAAPVVERTPHLDVDGPSPLSAGTHAKVIVYVNDETLREGEHGTVLRLPALEELPLGVSLSVSPHFRIIGDAMGEIVVRPEEKNSTEAEFEVECIGGLPGPGVLAATFSHEWRPVGSVWREVAVAGATGPRLDLPAPTVSVDTDARPADLVVTVKPTLDADERHYELTVSSRHLAEFSKGVVVPWNLPTRTRDYVLGFMKAFTTSDPGGRRAALIGAGKDLFAATPDAFQKAFWVLVDSGKPVESIFIVTSEPFIPWELMVPDDGTRTRPPLGVEFSVGRWVDKRHASPQQLLPITDGYVIAPRYRGDKKLSFSAAEAQLVIETFNAQPISPAHLKTIDAALAAHGATLLHLVCHGLDDEAGQVLELDPDEKLYEIQLGGLDGLTRAVREAQPLVFINACQVGRSNPTLVGTGGFAARFTALGARCVIAPIWSVDDTVAAEVARTFYERVKADPTVPFARVLRDIRKRAYEGDDPADSYAAYCLYGDPLAAQARPPAAVGE